MLLEKNGNAVRSGVKLCFILKRKRKWQPTRQVYLHKNLHVAVPDIVVGEDRRV